MKEFIKNNFYFPFLLRRVPTEISAISAVLTDLPPKNWST